MISTLIAGFAVWGGIGWLLDQWWGTRLMTPIGLIVGMALGIYAVVACSSGDRQRARADATVGASTARHGTHAARRRRRANRARASTGERQASSPTDGPPPAGTRRETECL